MVQIKIKGINKDYHVFVKFDDFDACLQELHHRLLQCSIFHTSALAVFFHLPKINDAQFLAILQVCEQCHIIMKGCNVETEKPRIKILQKTLGNGEHYHFHEPILLLGTIEQQAYVVSEASLYVLGNMYGSVDLLHAHCQLYVSAMQGNVRICDSRFQNLTSFSPAEVYYEHCTVKLKQLKEERMWERQLQ